MADLRALTLKCPWAWAVVTALAKDVENRRWAPPRAMVGRRIAIHAGKGPAVDGGKPWAEFLEAIDWMGKAGVLGRDPLAPGKIERMRAGSAIVALATLGEPVTSSASPWFVGPFGWPLLNVRALRRPVPCSGAQGLWTVPPELARAVLDQDVPREDLPL